MCPEPAWGAVTPAVAGLAPSVESHHLNPDGPVPFPPRVARWLARYGVAEVTATLGALGGALLLRALTGSEVLAAYGGAMGEIVGFYGFIAARDLLGAHRAARSGGLVFGAREAALAGRELAIEFGPGEIVDSLLIRPLMMGLGAHWLGGAAGIVAGKLAADALFYAIVIGTHEARLHARRTSQRE